MNADLEKYPPAAHTVKQLLAPGLWVDTEDQLHLHAPTVLRAHRLPVTRANCLMLETMLPDLVRKENPNMTIKHLYNG